MKWLIGIVLVMVVAHLYFRFGARRMRRQREHEAAGQGEERKPED
jgi:hypothetical protein